MEGPVSKRRYLRVESNPRPRQAALLGGADMEEAEPVVAELSEGKKKKGSKGLPPGILEHRSGKLQARLLGVKVDGKAYQRPIPELFEGDVKAVAAQAAAMLLFESGGVEAVWPPKESAPADRKHAWPGTVSSCMLMSTLLCSSPCMLRARTGLKARSRARYLYKKVEPRRAAVKEVKGHWLRARRGRQVGES